MTFPIVFSRQALPEIVQGTHAVNDLDRMLRMFRESELAHIKHEAKKLRDNATDVHEALSDVEGYLAALKNLAIEVRIWNFNRHYFF